MGLFGNENELEKEGKLSAKDVGFGEDSFEALKHACGEESHCLCDFINHPTTRTLQTVNKARQRRTELMELIIISTGAKLIGQQWCRIKHLCTEAVGCQELIARQSTLGNFKLAEGFGKIHKSIYVEYLTILGFTEKNLKFETSA